VEQEALSRDNCAGAHTGTIIYNSEVWGAWVARSVKHLPSAQVMISGSWDGARHQASCSAGSLLLSLPLPLPTAHSLFLKKYIKS